MATSKKKSKRDRKSKPAKAGLKTLGVKDGGRVKGGFLGNLIRKVTRGAGTVAK